MTTEEDHLRAAQEAVKHAQQLEVAEEERTAEDYWREAERQYEEAGLDPEWMDDAARTTALVEAFGEDEPPMDTYWLFPTSLVEFAYEAGDDEPAGIVIDARDVTGVDP